MYRDDYVDEGTPSLTLEEYRKLSRQQLRDLNDLEYGTVGGWGPYSDDPDHQRYYRGTRLVRAEAEVEDEADQDEADRWLAENDPCH